MEMQIWGNKILRLGHALQEGKTFYIESMNVVPANEQFKKCDHDYVLRMGCSTIIRGKNLKNLY
jgi:hypothetical protein